MLQLVEIIFAARISWFCLTIKSVLKELNELLKCPQSQVMDLGGGLPGDALGNVGKKEGKRCMLEWGKS